jgi:hypothetical protein
MNEIVICAAPVRWSGCLIKKNLCCVYCPQREECLKAFKSDPKNKVRPCSVGDEVDCPFKEEI